MDVRGRVYCGKLWFVRKGLALLAAITMMAAALSGCSVTKIEDEKIRDLEFVIVDPEEVPEEFRQRIEEEKTEEMMLCYADGGYLYIARGYGCQDTSGYSIEVLKCYETEEAICIETNLLGPAKGEKILEKKTCPYVVVKVEYSEKPVLYM